SVLLLEELEYQCDRTQNDNVRMIQSQMSKHNTAMIMPMYDRDHAISHLFISPQKHNGALYSHEEIFALQHLFKQVQFHIQNDLRLKQAQAMAKSIAHEMRNPLAQVQLHLEQLDQLLIKNQLSRIIQQAQQEIKSGQEAIHHGNQLIEMILQETTQSMVNIKLTPYFISGLIEHSIHTYAFNDPAFTTRIHFNPQDDFIIQVNKTLFAFIIFNLLKNAVYYFNDIPESRVEIYLESGGNIIYCILKITDPALTPILFNPSLMTFLPIRRLEEPVWV
ncbi:hybrid sensor histidine kinase/response regulator, partial [Vibrio sp. PP-XX7]